MPYIGRGPELGVRSRFIYTATANQTSFSGNDDAGITLAYTDTLYMDVYQNGVLLVPATDYAASTGTSVVLVQGASADDTVELLVFDIFSVADSVSAANGGSFSGNVGMGGTLAVTGTSTLTGNTTVGGTLGVTGVLTGTSLDISGNIDVDGTTNLDVVDIDGAVDMASTLVIGSAGGAWNGAANGRDVTIHGGSETSTGVGQISIQATDAFGADLGGGISFGGEFSAGDNIDWATLWGRKENATDDNTAGYMQFNTRANGGNMTERMRITSAGKLGFGNSVQILNGGGALASFTFAGAQGVFISTVSQSGGQCMGFVHQGSSVVGSINIDSSSTAYATSSDYRLKENVDYTWEATTRLKQLKPARFSWIVDETNTLVDGFLAHEVSSVVPNAVVGTKDAMKEEVLYVEDDELPDGKNVGDVKEAVGPDYQHMDHSKLVPLLVKTIQELEARITALEA